MKGLKPLLLTISFSLFLVVGLAFASQKLVQNQPTQEIEGVEINPLTYDLGDVAIGGGVVRREYQIKNVSGKNIKLKKIATSCMCTKASFEIGERKTKFFGMEGHGDFNPPVNVEIPEGGVGKVVIEFDPAAHGPSGVGPFERSVYLTFSDPAGIKELKFKGRVISGG